MKLVRRSAFAAKLSSLRWPSNCVVITYSVDGEPVAERRVLYRDGTVLDERFYLHAAQPKRKEAV
jgi:hypothetical protein